MGTFNIWMNGRLVPQEQAVLPVNSAAVFYATNVFEGIRAYWSERDGEMYGFRLADHFARLRESMKMMRFTVPYSDDDLFEAVRTVVAGNELREDIHMHMVAYVGAPGLDATTQTGLYINPRKRPRVMEGNGLKCNVSSWTRTSDNAIPARGKIVGSYVNSALAKSEAMRAGFDEAIVLNADGHIAEGSAANFFLVRNGVVLTPPITDNILEGLTRRTVIELFAKELGTTVVERSIDRSELYVAEEAFFVGTGVQIAAITRVDHRPIGTGRIGPVATRIRDLYFEVVRGERPKYRGWCAPVYAGVAGRKATARHKPGRIAATGS